MYKFRSMLSTVDSTGAPLPDDQRLTPFGILLRSSSLDELPQLMNIIRGQMSFVGPRPTLVAYRRLLVEQYPRRFEIVPGLTSLAGVRGRCALTWDEKFAYDVEYVNRLGFATDLAIVLKTVRVVLSRRGLAMDGMATSSRYDDPARP